MGGNRLAPLHGSEPGRDAGPPSWETVPFHFIWISLTIVYGFRVWGSTATGVVLALVAVTTGGLILNDAYTGEQLWGELFEYLMSAMFLAMVWHARRRQDALRTVEREADERAALLRQQSVSCTTSRMSSGRRSRSPAAISRCCGG